jgi:hypothetical protein
MLEGAQNPQIEILPRDQQASHPTNIVIREIDLPKYHIEQTNVVVEPKLDSTLIIIYLAGELKDSEMIVPAYNFRTPTGHTVTVTSEAGVLRTDIS